MKNLIYVISVCAFFSFSFISSDFFSAENKYHTSDLLYSENGFPNFPNPKDSTEPTDSSSDTPNEVTSPLKDVSGMFNERGYFKSNSFSFDDQEIINDFNGNLLYSVPMYSYALGGDMNLQMKLTYNGSVGHIITTSDTVGISNSTSVYSRRNINFPEWIIDLNGFALQTFNFETNFFTENNGANYVSGSSVNAVITGYHYDNELSQINNDNKDKINILMGDGSLITLENTYYSGDGDNLNNYSGNYIYKGKEAYYKAIVSYLGTPSQLLAGNNPRKVILLKGDGIEYIFEEVKIQFDDFRTDISLVNAKIRPMALYLKEIRDRFSHSIKISYSPNHPFPIDPNEKLKGRQLLKRITTSGISSTINEASFWFEYGPSICKIFHQSELNGNYSIFYNTPVGYRTSDNYKNQRGTVGKIINILNQKSEFTYSTYLRRYDNLYGFYNESIQYLDVSLNDLKRMKSSKTNLGLKRDYLQYLAPDSISIDLNLYYTTGYENKNVISSLDTSIYKGYGRDPFFVNMLLKKWDSLNVLKSETVFNYEYDFKSRSNVQEAPVDTSDDYSSTKTLISKETSTDNNSITSSKSKKYYKVYPVFNPNNAFEISTDKNGITKLIKDENIKSGTNDKYLTTLYSYEIGSLSISQNGYDGSFLNKNRKVYPENLSAYKEWSWNYLYQDNNPNKPVIQSTVYDPFGNYSITDYVVFDDSIWHKQFLNEIINNDYIKSYFYRINVPVLEKRFSPNGDSLQKKTFTYITDTSSTLGYFGQLKSEKVYKFPAFTDYIETSYEYCKNDTNGFYIFEETGFFPYKEGNLKLVRKNDQETKFFYNPISLSEVYKNTVPETDEPTGVPYLKYKVKYNNGTEQNRNEKIWDYRFPVRTDNYKINGGVRDTISITYKSYTLDGSPSKMIDQNKYLTQFVYEPIHRINSITLPGDFSVNPDSVALIINPQDVFNELTVKGKVFGNFNNLDNNLRFATNNIHFYTNKCPIFNAYIKYAGSSYMNFQSAFIKFDTNEVKQTVNFKTIDTAYLNIFPYSKSFIVNGIPTNNNVITKIRTIESISSTINEYNCVNLYDTIPNALKRIFGLTLGNEITGSYINTNSDYTLNRFDIKNLISGNRNFTGILITPALNLPLDYPSHELSVQFTGYNDINGKNYWEANYVPYFVVKGTRDISDTLKIPIIKGGTIKYYYDDINHKVNVYSVRNSLNNDRSRIQYAINGYGNVKEKDIFTSNTDSNTYNYKFNYLNQPAENLDALDQYTQFSYDGLGRLIKTKNADTSSTLNSYSYYDSLVYTFGTVKNVIEKQRFTDEEGNLFDKYFDAVGNLRREVKFVGTIPNEDFPPTALITDYKYDSLYRVTQVKTPNNKNIYYSYDGFGRQSKRITPDAGTTDFIYDKNNNLIYSQDANQRNVNSYKYTFRNYDGLNRLTGIGEAVFDIEDNPPGDGTQYVPTTASSYLTINAYDTISPSIVGNLFTGVAGYTATLNYTKGNLAATAYRTRKTDSLNFKYYRYDVRGRVIKMWNIISGFDTLVTDYSYNSQDQMTSYTHTKDDDDKTFKNTYDYAGRLMKADYYIGPPDMPNPDQKNLSEYDYNANSQVLEQRLNEGSLKNDYFYNNRNWVEEMIQSADLFSYTNGYYKNGNVKTQQISGTYNDNFASSTDLSFTYSYDRSNRLTASNTSSKNYELFNTYDNDGNILTLDRFGSGSQTDDFNYVYYTGTNKLQRVSGAGNQFSYDANGDLIQDALNNNNEMFYDHRNLITELKHRSMIIDDTVYLTKYYYDEAGSRIRKMTYAYLGKLSEGEPPANSDVSNTSDWSIRNDEVYSRDVSGREVAIYKNASILEYPFYGLDMIGKLKNDELHFYLKDHLGSVRAVVQDDKILSSQDYDAWGYILEGRTYQSEEGKFKFTGKERDEESFYDYFGARYYDARVGRWGQVEPLFDKYLSFSPYVYTANNPLNNIDHLGQKIKPIGEGVDDIVKALNKNSKKTGITFSYNETTKYIEATGDAKTDFAQLMIDAVNDEDIIVEFNIVKSNTTTFDNVTYDLVVGAYNGSTKNGEKVTTSQFFNLEHAKIWKKAGGSNPGYSIMHEITESYYGGQNFPGEGYEAGYTKSHEYIISIEPKQYYPKQIYDPNSKTLYLQNKNEDNFKLYSK